MSKTTSRKRYYAPVGTHYLNTYQEEIDPKTGKKIIVKTGETDVYARIQEDLEGSKIENILHAAAMGDLSLLNAKEATYADATAMPKSLMEAQNLVLKAKHEFENMPLEVRKLFDNSPEKYVSEMGSEIFTEKMAPYNEKIKAIKEAGNLAEYQKKVKEQAKFEKDVETEKGAKINE